jgi:hypothetical protein
MTEFDDCRTGIATKMDEFVEQVKRELLMMFPLNQLTYVQLAAVWEPLVQKRTGGEPSADGPELKDAELRTEFQLKWLTDLARSK